MDTRGYRNPRAIRASPGRPRESTRNRAADAGSSSTPAARDARADNDLGGHGGARAGASPWRAWRVGAPKGTAAGRLPAAVRCARRTQVWKARDTAEWAGSAATSSGGAADDRYRGAGPRPLRGWTSRGRYVGPGPPAAPTGSRPSTPRRKTCSEARCGWRSNDSRSGAAERLQASGTNESVRCRADGARTLDRPITTPLAQIAANHLEQPFNRCFLEVPPSAHDVLHLACHAPRAWHERANPLRTCGTHDRGDARPTRSGDFRRTRLASPLRSAGPAHVSRCAGPV